MYGSAEAGGAIVNALRADSLVCSSADAVGVANRGLSRYSRCLSCLYFPMLRPQREVALSAWLLGAPMQKVERSIDSDMTDAWQRLMSLRRRQDDAHEGSPLFVNAEL